jgi:shikimate dehydrogenase
VPFKLEAFEAAATRTDRAQLAQAANTLVLQGGAIHADNTDGVGLVNDIQNNAGVSLAGRDVLLIGAGGAGAGALAPCWRPGRAGWCWSTARGPRPTRWWRATRHTPPCKALLQKTELLRTTCKGCTAISM